MELSVHTSTPPRGKQLEERGDLERWVQVLQAALGEAGYDKAVK